MRRGTTDLPPMTTSTIATIILITYGGLLLLWLLTLPFARRAFSKRAAIHAQPQDPPPASRRRSPWTAAGTLAVFLANIGTMGMFLCAAAWPDLGGFFESIRIPLPLEVRIAGAVLFIMNGVWGLLVLVFNPAYTPFFLNRKGRLILATQGPYAIVRHPRYASESALNVILFLFTGVWIPLLGILGWAAIRRQAVSEEEFLLRAAPEEYGRYVATSGRFLPRWKFRKED